MCFESNVVQIKIKSSHLYLYRKLRFNNAFNVSIFYLMMYNIIYLPFFTSYIYDFI